MTDMSGYTISEKDIEATIRYLVINDPKNANRDFAVQLLDTMKSMAVQLVNTDEVLAIELHKALKKQGKKH